jgi:hypothetical protein
MCSRDCLLKNMESVDCRSPVRRRGAPAERPDTGTFTSNALAARTLVRVEKSLCCGTTRPGRRHIVVKSRWLAFADPNGFREGVESVQNQPIVPDSATSAFRVPQIPDYPSTHSVLGAAAEVLAGFCATDFVSLTTTSGAPFAGITRSFTSFSEAALENANSRVFAGIHFRSATTDGVRQGEKIGKFIFKHSLKPVKQ